MDGYLTIKTKIDTKNFDKEIEQLERKVNDLEQMLKDPKGWGMSTREIQEANVELEKTRNKLVSLRQQQAKLELNDVESSMGGIGDKMSGILRMAGKWAIAIFEVRTAYNAIRNASNTLAQHDKEYAANLQYISYALAQTLAPILKFIVDLTYQLLSAINQLISSLFGINLFANASAKNFYKAANGAKSLKKQLQGFDEMNVMSDDSNSGGTSMPTYDLSKMTTSFKDIWEGIKNFFNNIDWSQLFYGLGKAVGSLGRWIGEKLLKAWDDIKTYFKKWIDGSRELGGNVFDGILMGIVNAVANIGKWIYDHILKPFVEGFKSAFEIHSPSKVMEELGTYIVEGFLKGISDLWEKVKAVFIVVIDNMKNAAEGLWNGLKNGASQAWESIKNIFSTVGTFFKNTFTNAWTAVKNVFSTGGKIFDGIKDGILNSFKLIVNAIIDGINKVIAVPFNGINTALKKIRDISIFNYQPFKDLIKTISIPQIPRLATGAIINNPGKGVPVGGAIAGEAGREGIIPLTDATAMAQLGQEIGKWITVNSVMNNYMDSRLISRSVNKKQNQLAFETNGGVR